MPPACGVAKTVPQRDPSELPSLTVLTADSWPLASAPSWPTEKTSRYAVPSRVYIHSIYACVYARAYTVPLYVRPREGAFLRISMHHLPTCMSPGSRANSRWSAGVTLCLSVSR